MVYLKKEIEIFKQSAHVDCSDNTIKLKLKDFHLESENINDLLNVSVLKIELYNKSENYQKSKKFIIQGVRDKGIVYKNII